MQKPGGFGTYFGPWGEITETHSSTCAHCQRITEFSSLRRMTDHVDICRRCMKLVCLDCAGRDCRPFEKWLEAEEARGRFLRDIGAL